MRRAVVILGMLVCIPLMAQKDPILRSWNQPVAPFRMLGNIYYVGASDIASYLIATPKGHILIDGGFEETAPMIMSNIEKLGFNPGDIRILLNSHAHFDHAGGLAAIKLATGATLMAGEGDLPLLMQGGHNDPQFGDTLLFPPVVADRALHDGDRIALGGSILYAHRTPGHTPGCTTYTMSVHEKMKIYQVVFTGSPSVPSQYRLVGNARYPNVATDYLHTFDVLKSLACDVFLAAHGSQFDLAGKMERLRKGEKPNPFIDPDGYRKFVTRMEETFEAVLKQQKAEAMVTSDPSPTPVPTPVAAPAPSPVLAPPTPPPSGSSALKPPRAH